jgi:hypothetical protein
MGSDEVVDLTARDLALEAADDAPILDEHERRRGLHAEARDESRVPIRIELEHGEPLLLSDLDPRDEALHAS